MPGNIGRFQILHTLGSGASCKVKLGIDGDTGRKVAVKIISDNMDKSLMELVNVEVQAMAKLTHVNVINQVEVGAGVYAKKSGKKREVTYIVLELATGGELFDFVALSGRFEEPIARYYFKQFMEGLGHCHNQGITHRDLKPENLLLDSSFTLKLADFGFAGPIAGRDNSGYLTTKLGTLNYMAPEIHLRNPYQGAQVDIFAAAIILFIMVAQHPPFNQATPKDPFYKCLAAGRADIFWKTHCKSKPGKDAFFSNEFKELIQAMMQLDAGHRPTIQEILAHPWMQGPMPSQADVYHEFAQRDKQVKAQMEQDRKEKEMEKAKRTGARRGAAAMRSGGAVEEETEENKGDLKPEKEMADYEKVFATNTEFYSSWSPDLIEETLLDSLRAEKVEPSKVSKDTYKLRFTMTSKTQDGASHDVEICVRILKVSEGLYCVEFSKRNGDMIQFHDHFSNFKNKVLTHCNDAALA